MRITTSQNKNIQIEKQIIRANGNTKKKANKLEEDSKGLPN